MHYGRSNPGGDCVAGVNDPRPVTSECDTADTGHCGQAVTTCNYNRRRMFVNVSLHRPCDIIVTVGSAITIEVCAFPHIGLVPAARPERLIKYQIMKNEGETRRYPRRIPGCGARESGGMPPSGALITRLGDATSVNSPRYVTATNIAEVAHSGSLYDLINIYPGDAIMTRPGRMVTKYPSSHRIPLRHGLIQLSLGFKG